MISKRTLDSLGSSNPGPSTKRMRPRLGLDSTIRKPKERKTRGHSDLIPPGRKQAPIDLTQQRGLKHGDFIDLTQTKSVKSYSRAPPKRTHFRFMDLPAELRREVYQCLLPSGLRITFHRRQYREGDENKHNFINGCRWYMRMTDKHGKRYWGPNGAAFPRTKTNLFLVNKFVSNEARAVLYGENLFSFTIDDNSHFPKSLQSPAIFGLLGTPERLPLLRNLRNIEMVIEVRRDDYWAIKRHRARLEHFVSVLKQHSDDDNQKSLLTYLEVKYVREFSNNGAQMNRNQRQHIYGLESLASLKGIKDVQVQGEHLPDWYARCIELCINGKGGDVLPIDYPDIQVKKRIITGYAKRTETVWQTTRAWHQPLLNWEEFAERNGVVIPQNEDIIDLTEG